MRFPLSGILSVPWDGIGAAAVLWGLLGLSGVVYAIIVVRMRAQSLFGVGAAVLLLLFIGIHNAWDAVTYHVFVKTEDNEPHR